jgi:cytochrome c5
MILMAPDSELRVVCRRALTVFGVIALAACKNTGAPASAPSPAATATSSGSPRMTAAMIARGDTIFHSSTCTDCHGQRAKGSPHGPDLTSGRFAQTDGSYDAIVRIITTGVPVDSIVDPTFPEPMPVRGGAPPLSDEQIRALAAYVYSLSHR